VPWLRWLVAATNCRGPGLIPGQSALALWWTKWHQNGFLLWVLQFLHQFRCTSAPYSNGVCLFGWVRKLLFTSELESYAGRATHAAQVSSEMLDKKRYPDSLRYGLSVRLTCWLHKNSTVSKLLQSWRPWPENKTKLLRGTMLHILNKQQHEKHNLKKGIYMLLCNCYRYCKCNGMVYMVFLLLEESPLCLALCSLCIPGWSMYDIWSDGLPTPAMDCRCSFAVALDYSRPAFHLLSVRIYTEDTGIVIYHNKSETIT